MKTTYILILIFIISLILPAYALAEENEETPEPEIVLLITAGSAIVIDFESGDVLYEYNADKMLPPASMTKMMTLYLVYEAIDNGKFDMDTMVKISQRAYEISVDGFNTNVPLSRSRQYPVSELIDAAVAVSAGGATLALAEHTGGTVDNFLKMMNARVKEWGIDAIFFSTLGGTHQTNMTARAMSVITRNFIMDYPEILERTAKKTITFAGASYPTTNYLLGDYVGLDGFKTGTAPQSLECFSGTAQRDGIRIITVVMRSNWNRRFDDTRILLDYGFEVMKQRHAEAEALALLLAAEEEARLLAEAEEEARLLAEAEEEARLLAEAEEEARLLAEAEEKAMPIIIASVDKDEEPTIEIPEEKPHGISTYFVLIVFLSVSFCLIIIIILVYKYRKRR